MKEMQEYVLKVRQVETVYDIFNMIFNGLRREEEKMQRTRCDMCVFLFLTSFRFICEKGFQHA